MLERGVLDRGVNVALEIVIREDHAFRQPAGPARVQDHRGVVGLRRRELRRDRGRRGLRQRHQVHDVQPRVLQPPGQKWDCHDRVDPAVRDDVRDLAVPEQEIDRHDALASQKRSVETGDAAGAGRQEQPDRRLLGLRGEVHPETRRHRGKLLVGVLPEVVDDGRFLRLRRRVSE
jgi:hypothetical protein